jgi:hypothetical protein
MKITTETSLINFEAWCGAKDTKETILNAGKADYFEYYISEMYPDGCTDTELNDLLWFESEYIFEYLGISEDV